MQWMRKRRTSMDDITLVQIIHSFKDLADCLRRILFCELAVFADPVEQLSTGG
jgi:hypothetical protein